MKTYFALFTVLVLFGCRSTEKKNNPTIEKEGPPIEELQSLDTQKITIDTCNLCPMDSFIVKSSSTNNKRVTLTFDQPTAIEFFNLYNAIIKYDNGKGQDSLPEKLRKPPYRQEIYKMTEQGGYYFSTVQPELSQLHVTITSTKLTDHFVKFVDKNNSYIIDVRAYKDIDGVLMFTPGKKPIFWTANKTFDNCKDLHGFGYWYFNNCP